MRSLTTTLKIICIVFIINSISVFGQWEQCNGPYGGYIEVFAIRGNNIFSGSYGHGIYLSTNDGYSWTQKNNGLDDTCVLSLAVNNELTCAGTTRGLYISSDNGNRWIKRNNGLPDKDIYCIDLDKDVPKNI